MGDVRFANPVERATRLEKPNLKGAEKKILIDLNEKLRDRPWSGPSILHSGFRF